jgi:hypothetical protein
MILAFLAEIVQFNAYAASLIFDDFKANIEVCLI